MSQITGTLVLKRDIDTCTADLSPMFTFIQTTIPCQHSEIYWNTLTKQLIHSYRLLFYLRAICELCDHFKPVSGTKLVSEVLCFEFDDEQITYDIKPTCLCAPISYRNEHVCCTWNIFPEWIFFKNTMSHLKKMHAKEIHSTKMVLCTLNNSVCWRPLFLQL